MALPAALVSMITLTNTAGSVIGVIKRRCGACQAITDLATKSVDLVKKIRKLLKTLEASIEVLHDTREISTALNLRLEEFEQVQKNLDKMSQRTKRTHPIDRTEKFIMAQGWAKKMEAIHSDLVELRNGIESIVSSWGVGQFVVKKVVEEIVTIDVTKKEESGRQLGRWNQHADRQMMGLETLNYVDRMQMTMVKLTDANKSALNRYSNLENLSLPDALYKASHATEDDNTCHVQLMQRSAELLHPGANRCMGLNCKWGWHGVEQDVDLALSHYHVASSRGDMFSSVELIKYYDGANDKKNVLKHFKTASNIDMNLDMWVDCMQIAIEYGFETTQLLQPSVVMELPDSAFQQSMCHFFGLGVPKNNQKAVDAFHTLGSSSYSLEVEEEGMNQFQINTPYFGWKGLGFYRFKACTTAIRRYADFLFKSNQFLPFLLVSFSSTVYSLGKLKHYILRAARSHCVDAHLFLAAYYSEYTQGNEHKMKQHLRIAAGAGNSDAQLICRRMFGRKANVSKGVKIVMEAKEGNQEKCRHQRRVKHSKGRKQDS